MLTIIEQMQELVDKLNYYTKKYDEGNPEISDKEWDNLYFKLLKMEQDCHYHYLDKSPTRTINYQVVNELKTVKHNHKMLSLDKTKSLEDIKDFVGEQLVVAMTKVDGLTCSLKYIDGKLISAETRGDGVTGEDVLHNALVIPSIPHRINYKDELIIDGEIVCLYNDFTNFENEYKNPRNFAAGSIRLLDANECSKRKLTFIAWDVIKGFEDYNSFGRKMIELKDLGFFIAPMITTSLNCINESLVNIIKSKSINNSIPFDGVVFKFNDIAYGQAQGETTHHFKNAIAYKFYDEMYETILRDISWTMGRTGVLTPVAVFDPVDIDGSTVERANLHNLSIMKETLGNPYKGQKIKVFKANMIIPQVGWADKDSMASIESVLFPPTNCPICGEKLNQVKNNDSIFLICNNKNCKGKLINYLDHFCGKKGLDIKGLSLATLEKLVDWGWVNNLIDLYYLKEHESEWVKKPGFGEKSVSNILQSIEDSKNCSLESFISSLGIPLIGKSVSAELIKYFKTYEAFREAIIDNYNFSELKGFANSKTDALLEFDYTEADELYAEVLKIKPVEIKTEDNLPLKGKKYVITGTVKQFKNRNQLKTYIEERGGKVVSAISNNVDYLINNNTASTSAKNVAAKKMGIPIISEAEFLEKIG